MELPLATAKDKAILIVFLENGGQFGGVTLPSWAARLLDWSTEEYGKLVIRLQTWRHYRQIVILEDDRATAAALWQALLAAGDSQIDVLLLVHGLPGVACGRNDHWIGADFFDALRRLRTAGLAHFRLRAVYQMNCYGQSLAGDWLSLGAQAVNGAVGVNWLPEPSLSVFLFNWLGGKTFSDSIERSYRRASRLFGLVWRPQTEHGQPHDRIASSQMLVYGDRDLRIST
jgi:hypothetical protein